VGIVRVDAFHQMARLDTRKTSVVLQGLIYHFILTPLSPSPWRIFAVSDEVLHKEDPVAELQKQMLRHLGKPGTRGVSAAAERKLSTTDQKVVCSNLGGVHASTTMSYISK